MAPAMQPPASEASAPPIVVTGATGCIALFIVRDLLTAGYKVGGGAASPLSHPDTSPPHSGRVSSLAPLPHRKLNGTAPTAPRAAPPGPRQRAVPAERRSPGASACVPGAVRR